MKRLYFLLPNLTIAQNVVSHLASEHIQLRDIHVLASDEIDTDCLPAATIWQHSDILNGLERGLGIGSIIGAICGILAAIYPPVGLSLGGGTIIIASLIGALIGAWIYGMVGMHSHNNMVRPYDSHIEDGEILLMIDSPNQRVASISEIVYRMYPAAREDTRHSQSPAFL